MLGFAWPTEGLTTTTVTDFALVMGAIAFAVFALVGILYVVYIERIRKRMAPPVEEPKEFLEAA